MKNNWKNGNIVADKIGTLQIVLFLDNDGTFKCMDFKGNINKYAVACHEFKANNLKEFVNKRAQSAIDHLEGKPTKFSSRNKIAVIDQLQDLIQ